MRSLTLGLVAIPTVIAATTATANEDSGVSFSMTSDGPPKLEAAVRPYRDCVTAWMSANRGSFEAILQKMDFRKGPPECAEQRRQSSDAGFAALDSKLADVAKNKMVRQELLTIDLSIFSGLVWTSQNLPENQ